MKYLSTLLALAWGAVAAQAQSNAVSVTVQPVNQTVPCSGTAIFSVGVSGAAPFGYQWHDICGDIPGATNDTLVLNSVTLADAGNYFVTISNAFGVVTSDDATLAVNPSVSPVLPRLHIAQGANAEISWPANSATFVLQETPNLNPPIAWTAVSQVAVTNGTNLTVSVPFGAGNKFFRLISTNPTPLCPPLPLPIVGTPAGRAVNIPATVGLSVTATGVGPLSYQWKLNGTTLPDKTNSSLLVSVMSLTNLGAYSVSVYDGSNSAYSSPAVIRLAGLETVLADDFANRSLITNASGSIHGRTFGATRESNEPVHAGIPGGKSVWVTWQAPANGIATFDTIGSGFDTLLAVYTGTDFATFVPQASDDDAAGFLCSRTIFNVIAGTDYHVALDGLAGESGFFHLKWSLDATAETVPVITSQPADSIVESNQMALFSVSNAVGSNIIYQWQFEGANIAGETNSTLARSGQFTNIGNYAVVVSDGARSTISRLASLQLATNPTNFQFVPKALVNFTCLSSSNNNFAPLASKTKPPLGIAAPASGSISARIGSLNRSTLASCATRTHEMYITNFIFTCASGTSTVTVGFKGSNSATTLEVYDALYLSLGPVACVVNTSTANLATLTFNAISDHNYFVLVSSTKGTTIVTMDYAATCP